MPTLHWIGKEKIISHHQEVPYRVLNRQYGFTREGRQLHDTHSGNKIIHGDNLEALKSLLPQYEGKIKCIYIDPPYNTGNEGWVYNDNVNDPVIRRWLEKTLNARQNGKDAAVGVDDLTRHDKWLCMMYPRLQLLHKLLADDGAIFISIDDNEIANLRVIMDEIFGKSNFIEYFSWIKTSTPPSLSKKSRKTTEYILCYEKKRTNEKYKAEIGDGGDAPLLNSGNAITELVFPPESIVFKITDGHYKAGAYEKVTLNNDLIILNGYANTTVRMTGAFKWTQDNLNNEIKNGTMFIIKSEKFSIRYLREVDTFKAPTNLLKDKYLTPLIDKKVASVDTNEGAKKEIVDIFGRYIFDYPKPVSLVRFFINLIHDKNAIILDSFAGSGTTAHAVLNLNKQDGGNRKFILVEIEEYADTITAERVKRVIQGYGSTEGTGGSFDYYTLGETLFDEDDNLNANIDLRTIREYIWYSETRSPLNTTEPGAAYLGKHNGTGYYFMYSKEAYTTLDYEALAGLVQEKAERYVIYADNCLLDESFTIARNIEFKKIPRDISRL